MHTLSIVCGFGFMLLGPCLLAASNFRPPLAAQAALTAFAYTPSAIPDVT